MKKQKSKLQRLTAFDIGVYALLVLFAVLCLIPLLNSLAISLSDKTSAALGQVILLPKNLTFAAYIEMAQDRSYFRAFGVSVLVVVSSLVINLTLSILMAYPLSKTKEQFHARGIYMGFVIFCMYFSGGLVANYLLIRNLGMMDTLWALILPGAVPVFSVIILMNFFKGMPQVLEEAAMVDGANPPFILFRIYLPLAKASIATIALFSIVGNWNAFFGGQIYINSAAKKPLQTYIRSLTVQLSPADMVNLPPEEIERKLMLSDITFNSAKVIFSMIPILLIYPFLQKYFVTGLVMGAVKE